PSMASSWTMMARSTRKRRPRLGGDWPPLVVRPDGPSDRTGPTTRNAGCSRSAQPERSSLRIAKGSHADRERFNVDAASDVVYALMIDVERVATCLPGAEVLGR